MRIIYKFTDTEIKKLLNTITVIIDTREQENSHIISYLEKKKKPYKSMKLDYGDYTAMIPKNEALGIFRDLYFMDIVSIERKGSLEELSNNFTHKRNNIIEEFTRWKGQAYLLIENSTYEDIVNGNYKTKYDPKSFIATLKAFEIRYNIKTNFISKKACGNFIYYTLYYGVREYLKNM